MTTNEIADVIIMTLVERSFPVFLTTYSGGGLSESDVLGINRNGYIYEYEIKKSRSDFFADFKNKDYKHKNMSESKSIKVYDLWLKGKQTGETYEMISIPNRFYFVCERSLIKPEEVPDYAGLIYIERNEYYEVKSAKLLHKNKANQRIYERVATILSQRIIYGCSYYTFKHKNKP